MIEFDNVMRLYTRKVAVDRLTLAVFDGELSRSWDPNGAGKTTAIKMLTGLLRPTEGSLRVCGHDVVKETRLASLSIGYVPETPFLYDKLSGREFWSSPPRCAVSIGPRSATASNARARTSS